MKYILAIILIFTTSLLSQAQTGDSVRPQTAQADSTTASSSAPIHDIEDDFNPGLFMFVLIFLGIIIAAIAFGVFLTVISVLGIFAMTSFGILSVSIFAGLYTRSVTKGFKVFFLLCSIVVGCAFGGTTLCISNFVTHWYNVDDAILLGSAFGLVAGLAMGLIALYILHRLAAWLRSKITIQTIPR